MPSLTVPMNSIADLVFVGLNKNLPVDWMQPVGEAGKQYVQSFKLTELARPLEPQCYMWASSVNKYHVETSKKIGKAYKDFAHKALDATKKAIDQWRLQTKFKDLKVNAVSAMGTPGCLDGPELKSCYMGFEGKDSNEKAYVKAVKEGVSKCWKEWQDKVMVPGLPWYPAFATFPSPQTPPMPNTPMPLITCPSPMMTKMTPTMLRDAMIKALDSKVKKKDKDKQHEALFMAIGTAISTAFLAWLPMQMVMTVMGKGSVPVYAPPAVPVGPVVMGDNVAAPGHLAT